LGEKAGLCPPFPANKSFFSLVYLLVHLVVTILVKMTHSTINVQVQKQREYPIPKLILFITFWWFSKSCFLETRDLDNRFCFHVEPSYVKNRRSCSYNASITHVRLLL